MIVELLDHNPIFTVGYKSVLHIHTAVEECEVTKMVAEVDMKTKEQKKVGGWHVPHSQRKHARGGNSSNNVVRYCYFMGEKVGGWRIPDIQRKHARGGNPLICNFVPQVYLAVRHCYFME